MELFSVVSSKTKATSVSAGGKLTLDSLSLVITAAVNAPQLAQRQEGAQRKMDKKRG